MNNGLPRLSLLCGLCLMLVLGLSEAVSAKVPEGHRDIRLGMNKGQVLELLKKSPIHFSYEEMGNDIAEIIRGDELFRFATYRFDNNGVLVEIGLQMREILGRDRVLELFGARNGVTISPTKATVEANRSLEVRDNRLIMKLNPGKKEARSSKDTH
jgi:hypothetical protein